MNIQRELIAINHLGENPIPIIAFARDVNKAEVVISCHIINESQKLLMFSKLKGEAKVGDKVGFETGQELMGLLFHNKESIESVIRKLEVLKDMEG